MAQTMFLPTPPLGYPNSPDPTPLRMLAFSVAEAALQNDPNSPSLSLGLSTPDMPIWNESWAAPWRPTVQKQKQVKPKANLWNVVERAKERKASPLESPPLPSPVNLSPTGYNFVLPANSPLAASIAGQAPRRSPSPSSLNVALSRRFPLETRSAEPSPTKATFGALDQSRPPPEFVPRMSAKEFSVKSRQVSSGRHTRTKSDVSKDIIAGSVPKPRGKLPSLAQIQAKMTSAPETKITPVNPVDTFSQRRNWNSVLPQPRVTRTSSDDSVDLVTPTEERPSLAILARRPASPPTKEASRLPLFLREKTARSAMSTPPSGVANLQRPVLKVTPPSFESRPAIPPIRLARTQKGMESPIRVVSPTSHRFDYITPTRSSPILRYGSPASPTGTASPTLSVPIITCTDSDEEDDVVVFDASEVDEEKEEREKRGKEMKALLKLRRRSD